MYYTLRFNSTDDDFAVHTIATNHLVLDLTVASLGWVTPGAAIQGVTPLFFSDKPGDLFLLIAAHRCHYHYRFWLLSLGCHPLQGVTPHLFTCPISFLHYSFKFAHKIFFPSGVTPWRVSPGTVRPLTPLVTPLGPNIIRRCSFAVFICNIYR